MTTPPAEPDNGATEESKEESEPAIEDSADHAAQDDKSKGQSEANAAEDATPTADGDSSAETPNGEAVQDEEGKFQPDETAPEDAAPENDDTAAPLPDGAHAETSGEGNDGMYG